MVKIKLVKGIPKWLQEEPNRHKRELIKENAYAYLEQIVLSIGPLGKTKEYVEEYIVALGKLDKDFNTIKKEFIKTTFKVIEYIYTQLKNNIRKINKEVDDGKILPYSPPSETKFTKEIEAEQLVTKIPSQVAEQEQEANDEVQEKENDSKSSNGADSSIVSISSQISEKSKIIKKKKKYNVYTYLHDHAKKYPK